MRNRYNHVFAVFVFVAALTVGVKPSTPAPVPIPQPIASVKALISSLSKVLREDLIRPFKHPERFNFGWVPGTRDGVSLKDINVKQRKLMFDVLRSVLSPEGFQKIRNILHAEAALAKIEDAPDSRSPQKYWLAIFGEPATHQRWGLRFEGHNLSLNLTLKGNKIIAAMPTFIGSNPSKIPSGPHKGVRPMARDMDAAWALYKSLTTEQQKKAREDSSLLGGFKSFAGTKHYNVGYQNGLTTVDMSDRQIELMLNIIKAYVEILPRPYAKLYLESLKHREIDSLRFHWNGAEEPGQAYLFRLQGRRLLIEHDAHDESGHIHSIWRDKGFDFGIKTRWTPWDY